MTARRVILGNSAALYALQAANYVFPVLLIPYLLSTIGLDAFGEIAFTGAVVQTLALVIDFAFNYTATARIATARDPDTVGAIFSVVLSSKLVLLTGCVVVLAVVTVAVPQLRNAWPLVVAQSPILLGEALFPVWLFQGLQRLAFVTIINVASRTATLLLLFFLVASPDDAPVAALVQASHFVIAGLAAQGCARWLLKIRYRPPLRWDAYRDIVLESGRLFASNIPGHLYVRGPMVIAGFVASEPALGAFAIAHRVVGILGTLVTPAAQALYPHLCAVAEKNRAALANLRVRVTAGFAAVLMGASLAVALLAPQVVDLLAREPAPLAPSMLRAFSPIIVLTGLNVISVNFVLALRRFEAHRRTLILGATLFTLLTPILLAAFDLHGLIIAIGCTELMIFASYSIALSSKLDRTGSSRSDHSTGNARSSARTNDPR